MQVFSHHENGTTWMCGGRRPRSPTQSDAFLERITRGTSEMNLEERSRMDEAIFGIGTTDKQQKVVLKSALRLLNFFPDL